MPAKKTEPKDDKQAVLARLQHFCAYQERCKMDVKEKMWQLEVSPKDFDLYLFTLENEGFIDEKRFAASFCRGKFLHKKWGKNKIIFELKSRKIADKIIDKAILEIESEDYKNTLGNLLEKKMNTFKTEAHSLKRKKQLFSYAIQKGYDADLISQILKDKYPEL